MESSETEKLGQAQNSSDARCHDAGVMIATRAPLLTNHPFVRLTKPAVS